MAASVVGIVFSANQGVRRALITANNDAEYLDFIGRFKGNLKEGEAFIEQPWADYVARGPDAFLAELVGPPQDHRCAVVDPATNLVVGVVHADPEIDDYTNHVLVAAPDARAGDRVNGKGEIERRFAIIDDKDAVADVVWADPKSPPELAGNQRLDADLSLKAGDRAPAVNARFDVAAEVAAEVSADVAVSVDKAAVKS